MESSLLPYREVIQNMIQHGYSDQEIPNHLQFECGLTRGFSKTNIRRFCTQNGIGRERVQDFQLEVQVAQAINEVCWDNKVDYIVIIDIHIELWIFNIFCKTWLPFWKNWAIDQWAETCPFVTVCLASVLLTSFSRTSHPKYLTFETDCVVIKTLKHKLIPEDYPWADFILRIESVNMQFKRDLLTRISHLYFSDRTGIWKNNDDGLPGLKRNPSIRGTRWSRPPKY